MLISIILLLLGAILFILVTSFCCWMLFLKSPKDEFNLNHWKASAPGVRYSMAEYVREKGILIGKLKLEVEEMMGKVKELLGE